jgi:hypothetical protein
MYGNWCGPGYGGGEPIDRIDACCKVRDNRAGLGGWLVRGPLRKAVGG